MKKYFISIVCMMFLINGMLFVINAIADDNNPENVYTLGEIIISGKKSGVESVSTIKKVTAIDIKNKGATNLTDILKMVPGVNIRVGGAGVPRVDIRGFKTRHVLLLLDGIPINDAYDGQFDPNSFPVEHIAEVKVVTGGGSVLYGTGGSGGIINIITKKGKKGLDGSVGGEFGSEKACVAKATMSGGTDQMDFFISGNIESMDAFPLSDDFYETDVEDGGARENSDLDRDSVFANVGYTFSDSTQMGLTLNWYQGENGVPPRTNSDPDDPFNKKTKYERVDDLDGLSLQAAFSHDMENLFGIRGWVYMNQLDMVENRYDDDLYTTQEKKNSQKNDSTTRIVGINTQVYYQHENWLRGTVGFIAENHDWKASNFKVEQSETSGAGSGSGGGSGGGKSGGKNGSSSAAIMQNTIIDADEKIEIKSAALEFEISPYDQWEIVLGVSQHFMEGSGIDSDKDTAFLLGARYDITEKIGVKTSYTKKLRFPSLRQLYDIEYGNLELDTEKTYQYEIGLTYKLPAKSSFSIIGFYAESEDYIEKDDDDSYQNSDEYLFKGLDISAETKCINNLIFRVAYEYLISEDKSDNTEKEELSHRPRNKYYLEASYWFDWGMMVHADVLHVEDQYYYANGTSPLLKRKLNDYTVVSMKISQSLMKNKLDLYVRAENLFDEDYEQSYDLPQAGRSVYAGFDMRF